MCIQLFGTPVYDHFVVEQYCITLCCIKLLPCDFLNYNVPICELCKQYLYCTKYKLASHFSGTRMIVCDHKKNNMKLSSNVRPFIEAQHWKASICHVVMKRKTCGLESTKVNIAISTSFAIDIWNKMKCYVYLRHTRTHTKHKLEQGKQGNNLKIVSISIMLVHWYMVYCISTGTLNSSITTFHCIHISLNTIRKSVSLPIRLLLHHHHHHYCH
jgi:hypothetical protein